MLSKADDFPVHQTPDPIAFSGTDRNFYDRYFFNGYSASGENFFAAALGVYPVLNVMDAAFCVVVDGVQHNLRASRVLGMERMDTRVGPVSVDVVEPLHSLRVSVDENEYGVRADVLFRARSAPIEEPRFLYRVGPRPVMDYTRLTQNGSYEGWVEVQGRRIDVSGHLGTRDRSWGIRPVGAQDPQGVAPPRPPQFYWLWAPMNFEDRITLYHNNADGEGRSWNTHAVMAAAGEGPVTHMASCSGTVAYRRGTRHARQAEISMRDAQGAEYRIELEPQWNFYMSGLGYMHPEWGHGRWRGEMSVGYDAIDTARADENDFLHQHVQAFTRATLSGPAGLKLRGCGVLEQLVIGPYAPGGLTGLLDGAP